MADRSRRTRRGRRPGARALSLAQAEAALPDDVRRRWRAGSRPAHGWVPDAPEAVPDEMLDDTFDDAVDADTSDEDVDRDGSSDAAQASSGAWVRDGLRRRVPFGLRGADVVPSGGAVAGLAGLLVSALVLVLVLTWLQRPSESRVPSAATRHPASAAVSLPSTATPSTDVVVHVTGAVRRPGLVELPGGARVDDAVAAAGGATRRADLGSVNLARPLVDGEQIFVLPKGKAVALPVPASSGGSSPSGQPIDLNTATLDQLDGLPGVGPVLAQRIIDWRTSHGRFSSVDELTEVSGIGERTLADLRPLVRT